MSVNERGDAVDHLLIDLYIEFSDRQSEVPFKPDFVCRAQRQLCVRVEFATWDQPMRDVVQAMADDPDGKGAGRMCPNGLGIDVFIELMKWNGAFDQGKIEFYLQFPIPVRVGTRWARPLRLHRRHRFRQGICHHQDCRQG